MTALVASIVGLLLLFLAFLTFNAPVLLVSFVAAIVGLVAGVRTRHEVAITIAVLAILGGIALIIGVAV
ncbi:hypothetical protein ACIRG5_42270 [Lentzea sp. NPDC102401]|uniref:hypothetical protein n=1 Tax=Lentzea sp. NPDC102401 TaxID=3364128 RepID=UPI00381597D8